MVKPLMRFESRILTYGPVMPPSGPARENLMRSLGDAAIRNSRLQYRDALRVIAPLVRQAGVILPAFSPPVPTELTPAHGKIFERRQSWKDTRERVHRTRGHFDEPLPGDGSARSAAQYAWDALNYLEDTERRAEAHLLLHQTSELVGGLFGCRITKRDGTWWHECTSRLGHIRMGMSAGFTARRRCSLCLQDASTCSHLAGRRYAHVAMRDAEGICNMCHLIECDHVLGERYEGSVHYVIYEADLLEVSMVPRPRDPLARLTAVEMKADEMADRAGAEQWRLAGETSVRCYSCIAECPGLSA